MAYIEELPSNSKEKKNDSKVPERKKLEPVVETSEKVKKSWFKSVVKPDDPDSLWYYIVNNVIIPHTKNIINDVVQGALFKGGINDNRGVSNTNASRVSYKSFYDDRRASYDRREPPRERRQYSYDDVAFRSFSEANMVLSSMEEVINTYGTVSIMDFYELANIPAGSNYTDNRYGWTNLRDAKVVNSRGSYFIKFPRVMPLD